MPLNKVTVAISDELLTAADKQARSENSSRSKIVAAALEAYLGMGESDRSRAENLETIMVPRDTVIRLETELEKRERELRHKDELLFMKTDMIERLTAQYESFKLAREDEIKRYETIAGFYGSESSKVISRLADVSEALTRLLPQAASSTSQTTQGEVEAEEVQAPLPEVEEELPKRSLRERLFGHKPKAEEVKRL